MALDVALWPVARPWCSPVSRISSGASWLWPLVGPAGLLIWNWSPARRSWAMWAAPSFGAVFAGVVLQAPALRWPGVCWGRAVAGRCPDLRTARLMRQPVSGPSAATSYQSACQGRPAGRGPVGVLVTCGNRRLIGAALLAGGGGGWVGCGGRGCLAWVGARFRTLRCRVSRRFQQRIA